MAYFVHVDLTGAEGPAVHRATCHCVRGRRPNAVGARWYGPFAPQQARLVARREAGLRAVRDAPRCCGGLGEAPSATG